MLKRIDPLTTSAVVAMAGSLIDLFKLVNCVCVDVIETGLMEEVVGGETD